ncbi:kinase-like domain-containing protein [Scheffersomyces coipomensis]|uniref:kinase-like domain-containing protein n=1 Tax=Scheffersomyces coipomensis TaxID=1788519 RepID=UPI00315CC07A
MSLISNRKRPRGFSETFDNATKASHHQQNQILHKNNTNSNNTTSGNSTNEEDLKSLQLNFMDHDVSESLSSSSINSSPPPTSHSSLQYSNLIANPFSNSISQSSHNNILPTTSVSTIHSYRTKFKDSKRGSYFINDDDDFNEEIEDVDIEQVLIDEDHGLVDTVDHEDEDEEDDDDDDDDEDDDQDEDEEDNDIVHDLHHNNNNDNNHLYVEEDEDDVIILEERSVLPKTKRNNSDSVLLDHDAFEAYNMFNVNNVQPVLFEPEESSSTSSSSSSSATSYSSASTATNISTDLSPSTFSNTPFPLKKQRTNSLPQLPQAKCFYHKLPNNYILQTPKLGNIKANVIPHDHDLPPCDDENGHYIIKLQENFAKRFTVIKLLGQGTFGKVVQCYDKVNRENVAIKIIRNIQKYRDAAKIELRILSTLKKFDNRNVNHCIHLRECFDYRGHICIVTDLLKISLYDFLEANNFISFPGSHIQAISKQLIRSVSFLHDLKLIHTDLKPENILLHDDTFIKKNLYSTTIIQSYLKLSSSNSSQTKKQPKYSKILKNPLIQIIDFGSAIFNDEYHSSIVSTRHYRAPEIVLGVGWSFPCDMWSVGCILVELIIGEPLFKTHDNLEHLAMIEKICGYKIDKSIVKLSKQKENECGLEFFTNEYIRPKRRQSIHQLQKHTQTLPSRKMSQIYTVVDEDDDDADSTSSVITDDTDDEFGRGPDEYDDEEDDDDDLIIDEDSGEQNSLTLKFPTPDTPMKFINSVDELTRIDLFISSRIGLNIDLDYSLSYNYKKNEHLINFGNFTFWWFFIDLLKKLFIINPKDRLTAMETLNHPWFNLGIEDEGTL